MNVRTGVSGAEVWLSLLPIVIAAVLAAIGWLIRSSLARHGEALSNIEEGQARATATILAQIGKLEVSVTELRKENRTIDRRVTRLESWRDLMTLPDPGGRSRRATDSMED